MNIPLLYESNEKQFLHAGIGSLAESVRCEVHEVLNAEFELELEYPVNGKLAPELLNGRFIYAFVDEKRGFNPFEIDSVEKNMFEDTFIVKASHQTNVLRKRMVKEFKVENVSCTTAMNQLKESLLEATHIQFYSDIATQNSTLLRFKSALSCIAGVEGSILDTWRGEIERTTNKISMLAKRGTDSGVSIAFKKNMTGLNVNVDTLDMVNAILPYAIKSDNDNETVISLKENYIYSPDYKTGDEINAVEVDFSSEQSVVDEMSLRNAAKNYFTGSEIDKPKLDLDISFQDLGQTEEYKNFQNMNKVFIGDTLSAFHEDLNTNITSRMVEFTMDSLKGEYINCILGSIKSDFKSTVTAGLATKDEIDAGNNRLQMYVDDLTDQITGNQGGNLIIRPKEKPGELLIMDTESIDTAVNLWRFNQAGLGHSSSGYNGEYTIGLTQDGKIVADLIAVGTLKSIDIESVNITSSRIQADEFSAIVDKIVPNPPGDWIKQGESQFTVNGDNLSFELRNASGGVIGKLIMDYGGYYILDNQGRQVGGVSDEIVTSHGISVPSYDRNGWGLAGFYIGVDTSSGGEVRVVDKKGLPNSGADPLNYTYGNIRAKGFIQQSTEKAKEDIKPITEADFYKTSALEIILETPIYEFKYKNDSNKQIGFIAEQSPRGMLSDEGNGVDNYKTTAYLWRAVQELKQELDEVKRNVKGN
ncbi:phage tail spike protein [Listeria sp. ILCC797]|uniref:phage tail spike protein n=1 Tax=Listeria sp. ILCC797 TaxID=1918333 RepID=UPI002100D704|nr:phage tail spike protein [Listeria sp. ILCC797]